MFLVKARSQNKKKCPPLGNTLVLLQILDLGGSDKHCSLLHYGNNYDSKKFCIQGFACLEIDGARQAEIRRFKFGAEKKVSERRRRREIVSVGLKDKGRELKGEREKMEER
jgi:hypothetical protein